MGARRLMQRSQLRYLGGPMRCREILEMGVDHAQRSGSGFHIHFERCALHVRAVLRRRSRQDMVAYLEHRQPRQRHVAELAALAELLATHVGTYAKERFVVGQQSLQHGDLVCARPVDRREVARNLLHAQHIGVAECSHCVNDARQIDHTVTSLSPTNIPADDLDHLRPARINDCTNWRWNNKKANSSGATASSVPAEMIDQSTPDSGAPKIAKPTVNGRVSTEFVITSGHKKLFQ